MFCLGLLYLERRRKRAQTLGEGYLGFNGDKGETAAAAETIDLSSTSTASASIGRQVLAFVPLVLVGVANKFFIISIPKWYPEGFDFSKLGLDGLGKVDLGNRNRDLVGGTSPSIRYSYNPSLRLEACGNGI